MKIRQLGTELFHADGQTDRGTDRRKDRHDKVSNRFRNFSNAPKDYALENHPEPVYSKVHTIAISLYTTVQ